ncbi:MAG TPA: hypothetical protein VJ063_01435 [Verrucomicrobiae bacterium]|nr:hypothetical protein [Verrucomicrobiae bacterium]
MRTKTLLLTAALSAAGLATSMAQVYSVNAVGYVNQSVPANGLAILAVPLNGTNNSMNTTLALPNGFDGTTAYRFDASAQNYRDPITWIEGFGWFSASDADPTINPGEGVWIQNLAAAALNITFVGEVPSGTLNNAIPGGNQLKLASSVVPKGLPIGDAASAATTLGFPAGDGDTLYVFSPAIQNYKDPYTYIDGFGWFSANADDSGPGGPVIAPGTGFWTQKAGAPATWTQTFSVN